MALAWVLRLLLLFVKCRKRFLSRRVVALLECAGAAALWYLAVDLGRHHRRVLVISVIGTTYVINRGIMRLIPISETLPAFPAGYTQVRSSRMALASL